LTYHAIIARTRTGDRPASKLRTGHGNRRVISRRRRDAGRDASADADDTARTLAARHAGDAQAIYGRPLEGDVDQGLGCSSLGVELSGG
jgi:hypothetical protein